MKAKDLKKIYTDGILDTAPQEQEGYFNYYDGTSYLIINKDTLNDTEEELLKNLMTDFDNTSKWYRHLIQDDVIPHLNKVLMSIHFNVKNIKDHRNEWLHSFQSYFNDVLDGFFLDDEYGVLILEDININLTELEGFLDMIDDDFSTTTTLYIGSKASNEQFKAVFHEEQHLFKSSYKNYRIVTYVDLYMPRYLAPSLKQSVIGNQIRDILINDDELVKLIQSLWSNQGNLTKTAEDLFIHRNTINYRIDKLEKDFGLNLRDTQQLLMSYLLTI